MIMMFSSEDQEIKLYSYDAVHKNFISSFVYFWANGTGFAANSTNIAPPDFQQEFTAIFNEETQVWSVVEDHRGEMVYSTEDKTEQKIDYVGPIKAGFTRLKPSNQFHEWNGTEWVDNRTSEEIATYSRSLLSKLSKRQFALYLYDNKMYDQVMGAINANPRFKIEYDSVSDIDRLSPTVSAMAVLLGWSDEQVDAMWQEALTL